jgi:hypothetical protein
MGFRECSPLALLLTLESKACGQQELWDLISSKGFRVVISVVLLPGEPSLLACAFCYL